MRGSVTLSTSANGVLAVTVTPYARLYGVDGGAVYLQHSASGAAMPVEGVDTLVLCMGHRPVDGLQGELRGLGVEVVMAGDCLAPRTAEEAVFEGLKVAAGL